MRHFYFLFVLASASSNAQCWQSIGPGSELVLAIGQNGTLWGWGLDNYGQLGTNSGDVYYSPIQIGTDTDWVYADASQSSSFAIKANGTLWAAGRNQLGQLGLGFSSGEVTELSQVGSDSDWAMVDATSFNTYAIKNDGTLWAWGANSYGQIGDGTATQRNSPVQVGTDTDWVSVSSGDTHVVAKKSNGTIWAWGENVDGQLGIGNYINKFTPQQIGAGSNWSTVCAGFNFSTALRADGTIWSWGSNTYGRLGIPNDDLGEPIEKSPVPVQINPDTNWISISSQSVGHSIAVKSDGTMWSWGYNYNGQVGDGTTTNRTVPVQIGTSTTGWEAAIASFTFSLARKASGERYSWGDNDDGQLGYYSANDVTLPTLQPCGSLLVNQVKIPSLQIFPNPVTETLQLIASDVIFNDITITDILGKKLIERKFLDGVINVEKLQAGIYLVVAKSDSGSVTRKFIKR